MTYTGIDCYCDMVFSGLAAVETAEHGTCRVLTNLGSYQDSRRLHLHAYVDGPPRDA